VGPTELRTSDAEMDVACSDKFSLEGEACAQLPQLIDKEARTGARPAEAECALVEHDLVSRIVCNASADNGLLNESTLDQAQFSCSASAMDTTGAECSDSDGPPLTSRRHQKLPRTRKVRSLTLSPTLPSNADSVETDSTAPRRRKRLRRR
jgi:hypothetical protein